MNFVVLLESLIPDKFIERKVYPLSRFITNSSQTFGFKMEPEILSSTILFGYAIKSS